GVYVVFTTPDVAEGGFCASDCGWHNTMTSGNATLVYAFVGDGARCPQACLVYSPRANDNPEGDEIVNVLGHELSESVTDPYLDGWYSSSGENADRCSWNFGSTFGLANGANANVRIGDRFYLMQQNWDPQSPAHCVQGAF